MQKKLLIIGVILIIGVLVIVLSGKVNLKEINISKIGKGIFSYAGELTSANETKLIKEVSASTSDFFKEDFNSKYGIIQLSSAKDFTEGKIDKEFSLVANSEHCGISNDCKAIFKVISYSDSPLVDSFTFYDENGKEVEMKSYSVYLYNSTINKTQSNCVSHTYNKTTKKYICNSRKQVNYTEDTWIPYKYEKVKAGNYKLKLVARKNSDILIDWVASVNGTKLTEWADWTGGTLISEGFETGSYGDFNGTATSSVPVVFNGDSLMTNTYSMNVSVPTGGGYAVAYKDFSEYETLYLQYKILMPAGWTWVAGYYSSFVFYNSTFDWVANLAVENWGVNEVVINGDTIGYTDTGLQLSAGTIHTIQVGISKKTTGGFMKVWIDNDVEGSPNFTFSGDSGEEDMQTFHIGITDADGKINTLLYDDIGLSTSFMTNTAVNYTLRINTPVASAPVSVVNYSNISIYFDVLNTSMGNITDGVSILNVTIGGNWSYIKENASYTTSRRVNATEIRQNVTTTTGTQPTIWVNLSKTVNVTTAGRIENLSMLDDKYFRLIDSATSNIDLLATFNFTITENISQITSIQVLSQFKDVANAVAEDARLQIANYSNLAFQAIGTDVANTSIDTNRNQTFTGGFDQIINNSQLLIAVQGLDHDSGEYIDIDYIVVIVNATIPRVQEFKFVTGKGWELNVTVPAGLSGLKNLFINTSYSSVVKNTTSASSINYSISSPATSCTCPSVNTNWAIALGDYCVITTNCELGTGNITFTGTGNITFDAQINASNIGALPDGQTGYLRVNAIVRIKS